MILASLKEFSYGLDRLDDVATTAKSGSAIMRFYFNSLYQYAVGFFAVGGRRRLDIVMRELGLGTLLDPTRQILDEPLGETTFGAVIKSLRDKLLVHQSFRLDTLEAEVFRGFDPEDPETAERIQQLVKGLFGSIKDLYVSLAMAYPEAL